MRELAASGGRRWLPLGLVTLALALAWGAWLVLARVNVYAVSEAARLEVGRAPHPVAALVEGRVVEAPLAVGQAVAEGDLLVRLEDAGERHRVEEERARLAALTAQLEALGREQEGRRRALQGQVEGLRAGVGETRQLLAEAEAEERLAASEVDRVERLHAQGLVGVAEVERARTRADRARAAAEAFRAAVVRTQWELETGSSERDTGEGALDRELERVEGEVSTAREALARAEAELAKMTLRAPVDGIVGEAADLRPGAVVLGGERVAVVVPPGELRVVAWFSPAAAVGRVRPGQPGRMRLSGFPWADYGTLPVAVVRVGSEVREGRVRVELEPRDVDRTRIPLQHGLPGVVEVVVERVSPARLALRAAGERLRPDEPPPEGPGDRGTGR